jgi:hypothetical protein
LAPTIHFVSAAISNALTSWPKMLSLAPVRETWAMKRISTSQPSCGLSSSQASASW